MHSKFVLVAFLATVSATLAAPQPPSYDNFYLATFYIGEHFQGYPYQAFGEYGACYGLPPGWYKNSNSMGTNTSPPLVCCVFTGDKCETDRAWTPVANNVAQFLGVYYNGVSSYMCSPWVNDWSKCTDGYN